ncbi:flagellar motor protein MotA [Jannaschia pagri]|uniref:Flagellar motor protein MotA n=1 Tax=Jannaschia pagri TaxID=2829797 RepID=A0ABQ4NM33_9RHOB|nr:MULTISPECIES: flagellar basal body-associated protein FliL [unclassified Jannaschia]GIT91628.1 flagellar motor protein MotA [Jannaschia sp. AI_61]GIT95462.1 flagellar motor protein MotA [Jannaschia sp. AI_62]
MGKIIAAAVVLIALLGGAGAGHVLRPPPPEPEEPVVPEVEETDLSSPEVVAFRDPFVVPVLRDGRVWSHLVLSLGVESHAVARETILLQEPLLRDGMNEVLYLHASLGGFDGDFTASPAMTRLRQRLDDVVSQRLEDDDARVLIMSMVRQNG